MKRLEKIIFTGILSILFSANIVAQKSVEISKEKLFDKNKGGWAGQMIGCTFGGPTEFKFNGTMIPPYVKVPWGEKHIEKSYKKWVGLYDDVYMDLAFVSTFDRLGLDAPVDSLAMSFANASFVLWHANQAGRYNILNGIKPPLSGHWTNNPHADDLDFQIEADFIGLMSPGMINYTAEISDKIGHIMNYGDGWYGGLYVAAMYSLAYISDDIEYVVSEALKVIPRESKYYKAMNDVIRWWKKYPDDWRDTWFEIEKSEWAQDLYCPSGVFVPYNIDATVNSAYILVGLLYGKKDFYQTMNIAMRCGQDSDCNPASAAGILGTMIGYDAIPSYWKMGLKEIENIQFLHTSVSLYQAYMMSFRHSLQAIKRNGGCIEDNVVKIAYQTPVAVRFEKSFGDLYPIAREKLNRRANKFGNYTFEGKGFVITGEVKAPKEMKDYVAILECYIDGELVEICHLPADYKKRKHEPYWNYQLKDGSHTISFCWKNPVQNVVFTIQDILIYGDK